MIKLTTDRVPVELRAGTATNRFPGKDAISSPGMLQAAIPENLTFQPFAKPGPVYPLFLATKHRSRTVQARFRAQLIPMNAILFGSRRRCDGFSPAWSFAVIAQALFNRGPFFYLTVCLWAGFAPAFWSLLYGIFYGFLSDRTRTVILSGKSAFVSTMPVIRTASEAFARKRS